MVFNSEDKKEKEFEHDVPHPVVSTKQVDGLMNLMLPSTVLLQHQADILPLFQVEAFLSTLVSDTLIAELQLQV